MPTAELQIPGVDNTVSLAYLDSGAPPGHSEYTTILFIHGSMWTADTCQPAALCAPAYGVRLVAPQRRGYPGSTPFPDDEIASLSNTNAAAIQRFLRARSLELAAFVEYLAALGVPPLNVNAGKRTGGVALVSWSLASMYGLAFLEHVTSPDFPAALTQLVKGYVRTFITYDPPLHALGLDSHPSPSTTFPGEHTQRAREQLADFFTSYYHYPPGIANPADMNKEERLARYESTVSKPTRPSLRLSEPDGGAALMACNVPSAITHELAAMYAANASGIARATAARMLERTEPLWPALRIEYVYMGAVVWPCVYAGEWVRRPLEDVGRKVTVVEGANHYLHWEDPGRFFDVLKPLC